jgi:hypothetical protein
MIPIWTLDSRDFQFLPVMEGYWRLSAPQVRGLILGMHADLIKMLHDAGLDYSSLRNSLVPQARRAERAFVFKTTLIDESWYGGAIAQQLIPTLAPDQYCSILSGDLILPNQKAARAALGEAGVFHKSFDDVNTTMLHAIYVNNLTENRAQGIHERLKAYAPYIGYVPTKYSSTARELMSFILPMTYLKAGRHWLCESEGEATMGDSNVLSWPLSGYGYACHSVPLPYWGSFLSYKIERAAYPGDESDTRLALTAISENPTDLTGFQVEVEPAKAEYLQVNKGGSLSRAALENLTTNELETMIRDRIKRNYIYSLEYKHEKSFFNIMLEIRNKGSATATKLLASMEYQPERNKLRLVTLF